LANHKLLAFRFVSANILRLHEHDSTVWYRRHPFPRAKAAASEVGTEHGS
jgi:hypothetical protein